jgi:hypothetical protein
MLLIFSYFLPRRSREAGGDLDVLEEAPATTSWNRLASNSWVVSVSSLAATRTLTRWRGCQASSPAVGSRQPVQSRSGWAKSRAPGPPGNEPARANRGTTLAALLSWTVVINPLYGPAADGGSGNCPIFLSGSGRAHCAGQAVADGGQGAPGLCPDTQPGADVLKVGGDGLAADVQFGGDLGAGPALAGPYQYLHLAGSRPRRQVGPVPDPVAGVPEAASPRPTMQARPRYLSSDLRPDRDSNAGPTA